MRSWWLVGIISLIVLVGSVVAIGGRSESVCLGKLDGLDAETLMMCGDCFINGACGFVADADKALTAFVAAGDLGVKTGYSRGAWVMLNQGQVAQDRSSYEKLLERGADDPIGLGAYLRLMDRLAFSTNQDELVNVYSAFERAAYSGGLPSNLLSLYYMVSMSSCRSNSDDVLVRQKWLLEAQLYAKPFDLEAWNAKVERDVILGAYRNILKRLNPRWDDKILQENWCRKVTLPMD